MPHPSSGQPGAPSSPDSNPQPRRPGRGLGTLMVAIALLLMGMGAAGTIFMPLNGKCGYNQTMTANGYCRVNG